MKKLLHFIVAASFTSGLVAQTNLNLETWGGNNLNPAEWTTLNALSQIGTQTTFKETGNPGQGLASAKMVTAFCSMCATYSIPLDTVGGFIVTGDTATGTFGSPYTQTPQYLSFRYKANPQPGDVGLVAVQLTYWDTVLDSTITIAEGIFLEPNVVSTWTDTYIQIQYYTSDIPDTLIIAASSSASFIYSGSPLLGVKKIGSEFFADTFNLHFTFPCSFNDLSVSVSSTDETTPGANDGTATAAVTGGYTPFTYLWSNSGNSPTLNNLPPGTYYITVTDSVGCTTTDSAEVIAFTCDTLLYSDGVNFFPDSADAPTFTLNAIDNDSNLVHSSLTPYGVTSEWQIYSEVVQPGDTNYYLGATSYFDTPAAADNWLMFGGTTIPANGADLKWQHMFWDNGYRDGYRVMINTVGNTINDFLNSGTVLFSVADNDPSTNGDTIWANQSVNINGLTYGGQKVYIAFHHNAFDMFFLLLDNILIEDCSQPCPFISVGASLTNPTGCSSADGSISITPSGGSSPYSFLWSNAQTGSTATALNPGTFTVTISDSNGCSVDSSFTLTSPSGLSVSATGTDETAPGANDGTATATATGGTSPYSYNWSNGSFNSTITGLAPGTYTVTVTDASGCTATSSISISAFICSLTVSATATAETAPGANDGTGSATASGGSTPYSYNWSDGQTTSTATGLAPASYTVTVTDAIGCTDTDSILVDSFACALSATASATGETSAGASDGTATVTVTGGTSPFVYTWSNGGSTATITGLSAGTYNVTVTDINNCSATASAQVDPASLCNILITNISVTQPGCSGTSDGQVTITNTGGIGIITILWSNGSTGNTAYNLSAGTYTVTVSDINNCSVDTAVALSQPAPLMGTVTHTDETCAGCNDGTATVAVSGGTPPYSYNWTNGQSSPVITNLPAGIYSVFVQDANGCLFSGSDTVKPAVLEIIEISDDHSFLLYPNPNNGSFNIAFNENSPAGEITLNIFGLTGNRIFSSDKEKISDNKYNFILAPGVYYVQLIIEEKIIVKKMVVE